MPGAVIHAATLVPARSSCSAAGCRPAGEVGVEAFVLRTGSGTLLHVPVTYRSAALPGAEAHLLGTTEHSVLGTRWVYDGCEDPAWAATLAATVLTGGSQVEEVVEKDGVRTPRESTATVQGSGTPGTPVPPVERVDTHDDGPLTVVTADHLTPVVVRVVGSDVPPGPRLTA